MNKFYMRKTIILLGDYAQAKWADFLWQEDRLEELEDLYLKVLEEA